MARDETIKLSLIDGVTKNLENIREGVAGVGAQITKLNQAAELASKGFGLIGTAAASIGDSVQDVAGLETSLAIIRERTQATAAEMDALRAAIISATSDGRASIEVAGQTLATLTKEGLNATQAIQSLGPVLAFAAANGADASASVGSLLDVLGGFNRPAEEIATLADKLTALSRATGAPVEVLQQGLAGVATQADAARVSLDQALVLIGGLANRSIEGGRAAASLNKAMAELADPASKAGESLRQVGGDSEDLMKSLLLLAKDSATAEKVLSQLGDRPRVAMKALLADGGKALSDLAGVIDNAGGAAERASAALGETFTRKLQSLQNAIASVRNSVATPILEPLAKALGDLSTRVSEIVSTGDLEKIGQSLGKIVSEGGEALLTFLKEIDFEEAVGKIREFSTSAAEGFGTVVEVVNVAGGAIATTYDVLKVGAAGIVESFVGVVGDLTRLAEDLGAPLENVNLALGDMEERAAKLGNEGMASLEKRFGLTAEAAKKAAGGIRDAGKESAETAIALDKLALAMLPTPARVLADAVLDVVAAQEKLKKATADAAAEQDKLASAARASSIANYEAQLQKLVRAQADLAASGQTSGAEFQRLSKEIAAAEGNITRLREANQGAAKSNNDVGDSANDAAGGLRTYATAAREAGDASGSLRSSNSQVSDSFGNIGNQASETAISLGNLTEAYVQQALAAAGLANSARDYAATLNRSFAAAAEEEERIKARIELLERQNAAQQEDAKLRRQLELQYGTSSTLFERLLELEKERLQTRQQSLEVSRQEIQVERERIALAGAFDPNAAGAASASEQARGGTGGRGTSAGTGSREAPPIIVNVQGAPTDAAGWRDLVQRFIEPELARLQRLSR